jgi:hypothetical protein
LGVYEVLDAIVDWIVPSALCTDMSFPWRAFIAVLVIII